MTLVNIVYANNLILVALISNRPIFAALHSILEAYITRSYKSWGAQTNNIRVV